MSIDPQLVVAGALVGFLVGLTGMGGGALLTPILVLIFKVPPLAAVSSDLVTSLVMKPFGAAVHFRRGTVHLRLLGWLTLGSVPAAFAGAAIVGALGKDGAMTSGFKRVIAVALLASVVSTVARMVVERRQPPRTTGEIVVRPALTAAIGAIGGLGVGLTSVGAGSLIIAMLLFAYPQLRPSHLIGTDIAQAIPLVASASLGHLLFGDVRLALTSSLLVGAIPAVILGARLSSTAPSGVTRPVMAAVLTASALALFQVATPVLIGGTALVAVLLVGLARGRDRADRQETVPEPVTAR